MPTNKKLLVSELMKDYNLVKCLKSKLDDASNNNIKALLRAFELPHNDRCRILNCATQSLAFFDNLSKSKPRLKLLELKTIIEESCSNLQCSVATFMKVEEDIANGTVHFTQNTTLGELSNSPKDWCYILEEIVCTLFPEEDFLFDSWENIACACGYTWSEIAAFQQKDSEETAIGKLLSLLCAQDPPLSVSLFLDKLKQIRRGDAAKIVEGWLDDFEVSIVSI